MIPQWTHHPFKLQRVQMKFWRETNKGRRERMKVQQNTGYLCPTIGNNDVTNNVHPDEVILPSLDETYY